MYVCICKGVTESQICEAIGRGLCTRGEIAACLKAGTGCGKCGADIRDLLRQTGTASGSRMAIGEGRERKHAEPRRHMAVAGRVRRSGHVSGAGGGANRHEGNMGTIGKGVGQ